MFEELLARQREEFAGDVKSMIKESEGLVQAKMQSILNKNDDFFGRIFKSMNEIEAANKMRFELLNKRLEAISTSIDQVKFPVMPEPVLNGGSPVTSVNINHTIVSKAEPTAMVIESEPVATEVKSRIVRLPDPSEF